MRTYRDLFSLGEFRAVFLGQLAVGAAMTIQVLGLSVMVYSRTSSAFLAAVAFLAGSLPQALGAVLFSGVSDRQPPRTVLFASDSARAASYVLLAAGVLPVGGLLAVVSVSGVLFGALGGVRFALLTRVLPPHAFVLGRSTLNAASAGMQIVGYAVGGGIIAVLGTPLALWVAAGMAGCAAAADRCGLRAHAPASSGAASAGRAFNINRRLLTDRVTGRLLLAQWVPNGLVVGAEALFVPYAGHRAAILFTAGAAGMLAGNVLTGRWVPEGRSTQASRLLYLLLGALYLAFALAPPVTLAAIVVAVASLGFGGTVAIQDRFVRAVPRASVGQALALASAGMLTAQGLASYVAGGLAQLITPHLAMAAMGCGSLIATALLLRPSYQERFSPIITPRRSPHLTAAPQVGSSAQVTETRS